MVCNSPYLIDSLITFLVILPTGKHTDKKERTNSTRNNCSEILCIARVLNYNMPDQCLLDCFQDFHDEHALQAFMRLDKDNNGYINAVDFQRIMLSLKSPLLTNFVKENLVTVSSMSSQAVIKISSPHKPQNENKHQEALFIVWSYHLPPSSFVKENAVTVYLSYMYPVSGL